MPQNQSPVAHYCYEGLKQEYKHLGGSCAPKEKDEGGKGKKKNEQTHKTKTIFTKRL